MSTLWLCLCDCLPRWEDNALFKFSSNLHRFSKNEDIEVHVDRMLDDNSSSQRFRALESNLEDTMLIKNPSRIWSVVASVLIARRWEFILSSSLRRAAADNISTPFNPNIAFTCAWKCKSLISKRLINNSTALS